jgi:signal peptidase II
MSRFNYKNLIWLSLSVIVILLDQWTKQLAEANILFAQRIPVMPFFDLTLQYNTGAAFSFLADAGGWQRWFFTTLAFIVSAVLTIWLVKEPAGKKWLPIALTLIIGGAIGNVIDRLLHGHVIDFILWYVDNYYWPAFNIADSAIFVGAIMMFVDGFINKDANK